MCGLVGAMGEPSARMTNAFLDLLRMDVIRGSDSTGVAAIGTGKQFIAKEVGEPEWMFTNKPFVNSVLEEKGWKRNFCLMGHNRAATIGKADEKNAHPFRHGDIIMAHNGTLSSTYALEMDKNDFGTDSEHICYSLANRGLEDTWTKIYGAAALSFWNVAEGTLGLITNGQRPLSFAVTQDEKYMFWASEWPMLLVIANRHNFTLGDIVQCEDDELYSFRKQGKPVKITSKKERIRSYSFPFHSHSAGYLHGYESWEDWEEAQAYDYGKSKKPDQKIEKKSSNRWNLPLVGEMMTESEFLTAYPYCSLCSNQTSEKDYEDSVLLDANNVVCGSCVIMAEAENIQLDKEVVL